MRRWIAWAGLIGLFTLSLATASEPNTGRPPDKSRHLSDVLLSTTDVDASCSRVDYGSIAADANRRGTPPNPHGPVLVNTYLFVLAITDIDPANGTFYFEGYGGLIWCDPRLAFDPATEGNAPHDFHNAQVTELLGDIWWPGVFLPTQLGTPERSNERLTVSPDGTVEFMAKFNTRLLSRYDFTDFPFDHQTLSIPVQTGIRHSNPVELRLTPSRVGFDQQFELPEWWFDEYDTRVDTLDSDGDGNGFSRFVLDIHIRRKAGFYFWKILLPIGIIVSISFSVFWMTRDVLAQRQRQSATGVLTLVAFQFVATGSLPRVPYLTAMDAVILWSFITAASTMVMNVINKRRFRLDEELGLKYDRRCRWIYPTVYLVGLVLIGMRRYVP